MKQLHTEDLFAAQAQQDIRHAIIQHARDRFQAAFRETLHCQILNADTLEREAITAAGVISELVATGLDYFMAEQIQGALYEEFSAAADWMRENKPWHYHQETWWYDDHFFNDDARNWMARSNNGRHLT